ncbi:MAG: lipid-binding SYLF domain-containing protein [Candidatus Synoicihabitans palmerolidicus]|nr:lipid-binding SYLF domain-containing protein [Candidatus Synoicihabitans palmerolidicus]MCC5022146.1 lipid-binding SYLF domain-containing protein [Candidatus Synoicihabitans palmerolidicus]
MKRILSLALIALAATLTASAERTFPRTAYVTRIESCEAILREFQANPDYAIPAEVLRSAKAIIITNQFKAGFLLGIKHGYGLMLSRRANGTWSLPAFVRAGEASFGLQLGGAAIETVFILTDDNTPRLLYQNRFNVGVDAATVAGPRVAEAQRINQEILSTPILVYTKKKGLFAGATLKAGWLSANNTANRSFYNTRYTLPEIVQGDWVSSQPEVEPLRNFVTQITQ